MTERNPHLTEVSSKATSMEEQNCFTYFGSQSLFCLFFIKRKLFALTSQCKKYCVNRTHIFEW